MNFSRSMINPIFQDGKDCFGHGVCRLEKWVTDASQAKESEQVVQDLAAQADTEKAARNTKIAERASQKAALAGNVAGGLASQGAGAAALAGGLASQGAGAAALAGGLASQGAGLASQANVNDAAGALKAGASAKLNKKLSSFMFLALASRTKPYKLK